MSDRRFSEEEVAVLLRRTAELGQEAASSAVPGPTEESARTLSRSELAEVVAEAGFDVAHLNRALAELEQPSTGLAVGADAASTRAIARNSESQPSRVERVFGPNEIRVELCLDRRASDSEMSAIVTEFESEFGQVGTVELRPDAMIWSSKDERRQSSLVIRRGADGTQVTAVENLRAQRGGMMGGLMGGFGGGTSPLVAAAAQSMLGAAFIVPIVIAYLLLVFLAVRTAYISVVSSKQRAITRAIEASVAKVAAVPGSIDAIDDTSTLR